ncbi:uncharacterized protein LOC131619076 [Vicia villosa]|uniref:uncharacterized protein LOC131619076 n=1 Tax=Vicia villosa TaxID=3911 RepID=UPI00273ADED2|nr:uncharacterized protein LOC131619076 [Vicia villosa]
MTDILHIQETKLNLVPDFLARSFWRSEDIGFSISRSIGPKRYIWRKLMRLKSKFFDGDWLIGGDFNAVKNQEERVGRSLVGSNSEWRELMRPQVHGYIEEFSNFIDDSCLVDVPSKGKKFSWFSGDEKSKSRIDIFLVADNIIRDWGLVGQFIGSRDISDHCPIWLVVDRANWGLKPFCCNKEFLPFVEKEWKAIKVAGRGDFILKEKLQILKGRLRWWNTNVFGNIDLEIEEEVRDMNEGVDEDDGGIVDVEKLKKASSKFWLNLKIKENMLIQKSRIKWLNEGDTNSRYFHLVMKERRRRNHISPINSNSGLLESVNEVREEVRNHFKLMFSELEVSRPVLDGIFSKGLDSIERDFLEVSFSEEEIKEAMWSCDGSKSPDPDGYSFHFIKKC